jgi:hypothetical protein
MIPEVGAIVGALGAGLAATSFARSLKTYLTSRDRHVEITLKHPDGEVQTVRLDGSVSDEKIAELVRKLSEEDDGRSTPPASETTPGGTTEDR